jgi:fluoride ion exporter CrcB/FEX
MLVRFTGHPWIRLVGGLGFLGGVTTFSTLAFELHSLTESRALGMAVVYGAGTLIAGLAAVHCRALRPVPRRAGGEWGIVPLCVARQ